MPRLILFVLVFIGLTALATLALYDNGRLALVWGDYVVEMSATLAVALVLVLIGLSYVLMRLVGWLWHLPKRLRQRRAIKRLAKAEAGLGAGLMAEEHGDWQQAERALIKSARYSDNGVMYYLAAARMAHNQGAFERRDSYLKEARELYPQDYATIDLVRARLLKEKDPAQALAILQALVEEGVDTPAVLAEYAQLLAQLGHWRPLRELLPRLKRRKALDQKALTDLETRMWVGLLSEADDRTALNNLWHAVPRSLRLAPAIVAAYVARKQALGETEGLAPVLEKALKEHWDMRLMYLYGFLVDEDPMARLKTVQKWLKTHADDPVLLLIAGRLACRAKLWAQAEDYLRQSLQLKPTLETFQTLARCLDEAGEHEQAALTYQAAVEALAKQQGPLEPLRSSSNQVPSQA